MRLYEHEAKTLLQKHGYSIPPAIALSPLSQLQVSAPVVLKGQVLFGNRKQAGLIHVCTSSDEVTSAIPALKNALEIKELSPNTNILAEKLIPYTDEIYLALRYDTRFRLPVLLFSAAGGSGIEERSETDSLQTFLLTELAETTLPSLHPHLSADWLKKFIQVFLDEDMTLLEINPLVFVDNQPIVLDTKLELDDTAAFRHPEWEELYPPRTLFNREPTASEQEAKRVNAMDHRGVAGAAYFEFDGTIGILASGGGASLLAMDTLLTTDLKPANYTEYSGNPTREKVAALTKVVLSQPNLEGLWVIGGHANFTDIYETLMAVMDGVEQSHLPAGFPIIIRRGGPRQEEGFTAVRERAAALNLHVELFDSTYPLTETVHDLEQAVADYRQGKGV